MEAVVVALMQVGLEQMAFCWRKKRNANAPEQGMGSCNAPVERHRAAASKREKV